jgi:heat shock protein HslJ
MAFIVKTAVFATLPFAPNIFLLSLASVFLLGCVPQTQEVEEVYVVTEDGEVIMITVIPPTIEWTSIPEPIPNGPSLAEPLDPLLANTSWHLIELEEKPFPTDLEATMNFTEDGVEGVILCNKWQSTGDLTAANGRFSFPYIASTTVGCGNIDIHKSFGEALTIHAKT